MKKVLAFDIGGTKIAYAIIDENGNFISETNKVLTPQTSNEIEELLKDIICQNESLVDGVSIATAGAVNNENNKIIGSTGNLPKGYRDIDFVSLSSKPVLLENDASSAAWAEYQMGAAKGTKHAVILTLGTGVGSGIIVDGKLLKGKSGGAGEMHVRFGFEHARQCTCGLWDCLEAHASGTALNNDAKIYMNPEATSYDVIAGLKENNPQARQAFDNWQMYVENTLVMMGNIFDPEVIVLSGSMAQFIEYEKLNKQANAEIMTTPFELKQAHFANNAGMLGAALLLLEKLK